MKSSRFCVANNVQSQKKTHTCTNASNIPFSLIHNCYSKFTTVSLSKNHIQMSLESIPSVLNHITKIVKLVSLHIHCNTVVSTFAGHKLCNNKRHLTQNLHIPHVVSFLKNIHPSRPLLTNTSHTKHRSANTGRFIPYLFEK